MIKFNFNLPKYRLSVQFNKRRETSIDEPLFPEMDALRRTRSGNKVSRFFRHVFEHKNIRKILGTNLTLMVIASAFIPNYVAAENTAAEEIVITAKTDTLTTEKGTRYPTEKVKVNQGFRAFHPAYDFDGEIGDPIYPIMGGRVEAISQTRYAYGNAVLVNHGNKLFSLYAHLSKIDVSEGQEVTKETKIGEVGSTGHSSGPHLHLEVLDHGRYINPITILPKL